MTVTTPNKFVNNYFGLFVLKALQPFALSPPNGFLPCDICPFPTPKSLRYPITWEFCPGGGAPAPMGQKTSLPETAGPVPRLSRGDKTGQNQDIPATKQDMDWTKCDKTPPAPRSKCPKCPLLSGILGFLVPLPVVPQGSPQNSGKYLGSLD